MYRRVETLPQDDILHPDPIPDKMFMVNRALQKKYVEAIDFSDVRQTINQQRESSAGSDIKQRPDGKINI